MVDVPISPTIEAQLRGASTAKPQLDGYTIYQTDYPPPTFLFDGLLANGLTILAGRPKCGKSWLVLQMALDAARKRALFGRYSVVSATRALYCGLEEGPGRTHNRLTKLVHAPDIQLANIEFRYELKTLAEGGGTELGGLLANGNFGLVIIDTFMRLVQANGSRDVMRSEYAEVNQLRELAEKYKTAIVLVHHTRKAGAETGLDTVAGTTGITAACDAVWTLRKQASGDSILDVTGREMEEQTLALRLETENEFGWRLLAEGAEVGMSEQRAEILELLKDEGPMEPSRIAAALRKNAVTVRRLLQKMLADGVVSKDGKKYRGS